LVIAITTSPWLLVVGVVAIAAAWFYTGGKNPYGYIGLGEVFVFVFFGLVATVGSTFAVSEQLPSLAWLASVPVGCLACALLVVNNLRDIPTDVDAGKKTLAVRLGDPRTRSLYMVLCVVALVFVVLAGVQRPAAVFGLVGLAAVLRPLGLVRSGVKGRDLIAVLGSTGRAQMMFGVTFSIGLLIGA
jgi:1,4-dihydroxy-2-naphthoate octaprenyltransferase